MSEKVMEAFQEALKDLEKVLEEGARKHGEGSWLEVANPSLQHKANCASMFRHLAEVSCKFDVDPESGVDPLLHLACRAMMYYVRKQRGIQV